MPKYKPQHARLLFIDRKIREGRYPSCLSMAKEWEVTRKTIQRDISYMKYQLDAPIDYVAQQRGYCYGENNYQLPAMDVREGDLFAIYLAEKLLAQYKGTPVFDNLTSVFAKIADSLPDKVQQPAGQDFSRFTFLSEPRAELEEGAWELVFACLKKQQRLEFDYHALSSLGSEQSFNGRKLDPYHVVRHGSDWYVIGYCHRRKEVRTFNLARMRQVRSCGEFFAIPDDIDIEAFTRSQFGIYQGEDVAMVEMEFSAKVAGYIREKSWHASQRLCELPDGALRMSLKVSHRLELKKWLLGWGADVVVLSPDDFAEEIQGEIQRMADLYGKGRGGTA